MKTLLLILTLFVGLNSYGQVKCTAITLKGSQCTRYAVKNNLCKQHYNASVNTHKILPNPKVDLPEEWMTIGSDKYNPELIYIWRDTVKNIIYIQFRK